MALPIPIQPSNWRVTALVAFDKLPNIKPLVANYVWEKIVIPITRACCTFDHGTATILGDSMLNNKFSHSKRLFLTMGCKKESYPCGLMLKLPHTALQISLRHLHYRRFVPCLEQF